MLLASLVPVALLIAAPQAVWCDGCDSVTARSLAAGSAHTAVERADTTRTRPRAIEYSDAYYQRLTIHRWCSYIMLPLFAGEYVTGNELLTGANPSSWVKPAHTATALGLGALFTVNTVTGLWNLWDARSDPNNRALRFTHTALMLAADGGFAWAGVIAGDAKRSSDGGRRHRNVALGAIGLSTAGTALMWFWKN